MWRDDVHCCTEHCYTCSTWTRETVFIIILSCWVVAKIHLCMWRHHQSTLSFFTTAGMWVGLFGYFLKYGCVWPQRHSQEMRFPLPTTSAVLWRCLIIQGWMASKHIRSSSPISPPESVLSGPIHQLWKLQTCPRKPLLLKVMSQFRKQTLLDIRFCILVDCMFHRVSMQKNEKMLILSIAWCQIRKKGRKTYKLLKYLTNQIIKDAEI